MDWSQISSLRSGVLNILYPVPDRQYVFSLPILLTIKKWTPKSVIRGVQLSIGALLISGGIKFITGTSSFQILQNASEPYLTLQSLGPIPIGTLHGVIGGLVTLFFLDNKRLPAALIIVLGGFMIGLMLGTESVLEMFDFGFNTPEFLPFVFPEKVDFTLALFVLVLPQLPMTLGNAVLAYTDLSKEYFGEKSSRVSNKNVCISMALASFFSFCFWWNTPMSWCERACRSLSFWGSYCRF